MSPYCLRPSSRPTVRHSLQMSKVRQRSTTPDGTSKQELNGTSSCQGLVEKKGCGKSLKRGTQLFLVAVGLSLLSLLSTTYPTALPKSYALCSRSGTGVYTVDDNDSRVQCIVVHESLIIDTGDLGEQLTSLCRPPSLPAFQRTSRNDGTIGHAQITDCSPPQRNYHRWRFVMFLRVPSWSQA